MYWDSQDDPYDDYDPVRPGIWDDDVFICKMLFAALFGTSMFNKNEE